MQNKQDSTPAVAFGQALWFWVKLGFISFGGPAGQISIMHQEIVEKRRWLSERRFLHALNYCMMLPGPEAQQLATYLGWLFHGSWGGIVAGALFVLPSLVILIVLSWIYIAFGDVALVAGIFYGIKPAVTAIVVQAAYRIGSKTLKHPWLWGIAAASFVAIFALKVPFPLIVIGAALLGYLGGRWAPEIFNQTGPATDQHQAPTEAEHPSAPHTQYSSVRLAQILAIGAFCWVIPMGLLTAWVGWHHDYTQMAWFFTKAALVTFGGAYAVLPYVYQGAVVNFGWLSPQQMIDGLALGETTPGPLIMVVAFVAFVGGFSGELLGPNMDFWSGALAATLVTWFTFLPSFLFILIGGPLVESTHGRLSFTAPLTGITASVVGVILNLALFFGFHVLWPEGWNGPLDWPSLLIALVAAVALLKFKRGIIEVLLVCGVLGLALKNLI